MALLSLLFLMSMLGRSPESQFRAHVCNPVPASVRDIHCWHTNGYGNSAWILSFRIDPEDFELILGDRRWSPSEQPEGFDVLYLRSLINGKPDFPITYPSQPLPFRWHDADPGAAGGFDESIYTNEARDLVYVIGTFN